MKCADAVVSRCARGEDASLWRSALAAAWLSDAGTRLLKHDAPRGRDAWVWRARLCERDIVLKARVLGAADRLKRALGASRADRHWRGAAALSMKRIATARVLAMGTCTLDGRLCEWLAMEFVPGRTLLHELAEVHDRDQQRIVAGDARVRREHALARAVGAQVGAMLACGMYNRDHKPSNVLIRTATDGVIEPVVIDCVAIRYGPMTSSRAGAHRMLASLVIEPTGCGCPPRRSLMMRALRAALESGREPRRLPREQEKADTRALWRAVRDRVERHKDARPAVNPLG